MNSSGMTKVSKKYFKFYYSRIFKSCKCLILHLKSNSFIRFEKKCAFVFQIIQEYLRYIWSLILPYIYGYILYRIIIISK